MMGRMPSWKLQIFPGNLILKNSFEMGVVAMGRDIAKWQPFFRVRNPSGLLPLVVNLRNYLISLKTTLITGNQIWKQLFGLPPCVSATSRRFRRG
ncbi:MAG: hypothetical protein EBU26_10260 [Verrucomicrobia bacterium]|nr:hypothetical protein [Verrucomicrobiota bacterium]